jgi:hypothetical protein
MEEMSAPELVGTWTLESFTAANPAGGKRFPHGADPVGQLIYTAEGSMSAVLTRRSRPKFASADLAGGTQEELRWAFEGLEAYAGRYEVDADRGTVIHHLEVCRYPNWEGSSQLRYFRLTGDCLLLTTLPMNAGGREWVYTLCWRRMQ